MREALCWAPSGCLGTPLPGDGWGTVAGPQQRPLVGSGGTGNEEGAQICEVWEQLHALSLAM